MLGLFQLPLSSEDFGRLRKVLSLEIFRVIVSSSKSRRSLSHYSEKVGRYMSVESVNQAIALVLVLRCAAENRPVSHKHH